MRKNQHLVPRSNCWFLGTGGGGGGYPPHPWTTCWFQKKQKKHIISTWWLFRTLLCYVAMFIVHKPPGNHCRQPACYPLCTEWPAKTFVCGGPGWSRGEGVGAWFGDSPPDQGLGGGRGGVGAPSLGEGGGGGQRGRRVAVLNRWLA